VGQSGFDVVLVRKSGPVQSMTFKSWWLYLLFIMLTLMIAGLAAGGYLLYLQQEVIGNLSEDTRQMQLRVERLETLAQKEETRQALAQAGVDEQPANKTPQKQAPKILPPKKEPDQPIVPVRPELAPSAGQNDNAPPPELEQDAEDGAEDQDAAASETTPQAGADQAQTVQPPEVQDEPTTSDRVAIRNLNYRRAGKRLIVRFRVANARKPNDPAIGYATVVLRGQRARKVWVEAWPPMRLTPLGRPENYRRGTPFSVQHYRRVTAKFRIDDKKFKRMEIVVYSRNGKLLLVHALDLKL
jgi:hypothetical protein